MTSFVLSLCFLSPPSSTVFLLLVHCLSFTLPEFFISHWCRFRLSSFWRRRLWEQDCIPLGLTHHHVFEARFKFLLLFIFTIFLLLPLSAFFSYLGCRFACLSHLLPGLTSIICGCIPVIRACHRNPSLNDSTFNRCCTSRLSH